MKHFFTLLIEQEGLGRARGMVFLHRNAHDRQGHVWQPRIVFLLAGAINSTTRDFVDRAHCDVDRLVMN